MAKASINLINLLLQKPHDRQIIWVYDPDGHKGKSKLTKFLVRNHKAVEMPNKSADATYLWQGESICIWDFSRGMEEKGLGFRV